jgi:hypothetical protein
MEQAGHGHPGRGREQQPAMAVNILTFGGSMLALTMQMMAAGTREVWKKLEGQCMRVAQAPSLSLQVR